MITCRVETWSRTGCVGSDLGELGELGESLVLDLIASSANDESTTIEITRGTQTMFVSVSDGKFAVMLQTGEDDFYDLVKSVEEPGWVEFTHGGQSAPHPRRHIVEHEVVRQVVHEWLTTGVVASHQWERQGEYEREL